MTPDFTPQSPDPQHQAITTYRNPIPVAVAIVPVYALNLGTGRKEIGLLTIERGIAPKIGHLALPGGYIEEGEDWRAGLLRELHEETAVHITDPDCVVLKDARSIDQNRKIVLFGAVPVVDESRLENFTPHRECTRYEVIFKPQELAFDTHTALARHFFSSMWTEYSSVLHQLQFPTGFRCSER